MADWIKYSEVFSWTNDYFTLSDLSSDDTANDCGTAHEPKNNDYAGYFIFILLIYCWKELDDVNCLISTVFKKSKTSRYNVNSYDNENELT